MAMVKSSLPIITVRPNVKREKAKSFHDHRHDGEIVDGFAYERG